MSSERIAIGPQWRAGRQWGQRRERPASVLFSSCVPGGLAVFERAQLQRCPKRPHNADGFSCWGASFSSARFPKSAMD